MNNNLKFDLRLKQDAINGIIPEQFKKIINHRHIYRWRQMPWKQMIGCDYYDQKEKDLIILNKEINSLKNVLKKVTAENKLLNLLKAESYNKIVKDNIVKFVNENKTVIGVKRCSQITNVKVNTINEWRQKAKKECAHSSRSVCIKNSQTQLTSEEEMKIVSLLKDPRFMHYPLSSLMWKARYENIVHAGFNTWQKLKKQYQIIRHVPKKKRHRKHISLNASRSNQFLHADITLYKLPNNKVYYIYLVKDNYSKFIKSWSIAKTINSTLRIKTFEDAIRDINDTITDSVTFITDQGSENMNNQVKKFFKQFNNIDIKYAKKDIPFSNSMIERFNQDLKYMYLYRDSISSFKELQKSVAHAVQEHNFTKRIHRIKGQTPYEKYNGISLKTDWLNAMHEEAKQNRVRKTKFTLCCMAELK